MQARANDGVALWWERSGTGKCVLLVPGRGDSTDLFPDDFTDRLLVAGLSVLRVDLRDTGLPGDGGDTYTISTMADDLVAVLDAAAVPRAHVVSVSMGGLVTIDLRKRHPGRVRSLTFIAAMSPDPEAGVGPAFLAGLDGDPLERLVTMMGVIDDNDRAWAEAEVRRAKRRAPVRPDAGVRHQEAAYRLGWPTLDDLAGIDVPAVVVHGTEDEVLPLRHAAALGRHLPHAEVVIRDGMGHLPRRHDWHAIADLVVASLAAR